MKTRSIQMGMLALLFSIMFIACGKNAGVNCSNSFVLGAALADEATALTEASQAYSQNQTAENCENYKAAYRDYIQELKKYKDCAYQQGQGEEYEDSLEDAENSLDDLC